MQYLYFSMLTELNTINYKNFITTNIKLRTVLFIFSSSPQEYSWFLSVNNILLTKFRFTLKFLFAYLLNLILYVNLNGIDDN